MSRPILVAKINSCFKSLVPKSQSKIAKWPYLRFGTGKVEGAKTSKKVSEWKEKTFRFYSLFDKTLSK